MITKELLERLQSYLTKEEAKYAIPRFKKQYDRHFGSINQDSKASDLLLCGFDWELSQEGGAYWDKLYIKVLEREKQYER
jgi:hypothetical protein